MIYFVPLIAVLVTLLLTALLLSSKAGKSIQDIPNERSLHSAPIPRIGGVGLVAGILTAWMFMPDALVWWLVLPVLLLFSVSLLDDMRGLPVSRRLLAHLAAAALMVAGLGLFAQLGILLALAVLLLVVWMTNLYNFMDGSDGLAGGMALIGFACYGSTALIAHNDAFAMLNFAIAAAALGFLRYNFPPARVFMGDAGSITLGFLAAVMGLWGWEQGCWALWFPLLVFSPFLVDASVTLAKRILRGAKITEAHREHYYQRLIQMGWGHRNVALLEYLLMAATGISGLGMSQQEMPWLLFVIWAGIYAASMLSIDFSWKRFQRR